MVKEFETLKTDYNCTVISFKHKDWSAALSEKIMQRNTEVNFIEIDRKEHVLSTLVSKLFHKIAIRINPFFKSSLSVAAYAHHDKTHQLWQMLKRCSKKQTFKTLIAHNPGAFYPALRFYKHTGTPYQIDVEDFHPGEMPYFNIKHEKQNRILLMQAAMNTATQLTYAAPLIREECFKLVEHDQHVVAKSYVINNCFSKAEFHLKTQTSKKVKLVWFSQNIAKGRGLEQLLPVLNEFHDQIELHLIGNLYQDFEDDYIKAYQSFIVVHDPLPQQSLNLKLADFDIGLALEIESQDYNRQVCLTNKIWAYLQSGLFIFASKTPAQKQFLNHHNNCGLVVNNDAASMQKGILDILSGIEAIRKEKPKRFTYAQAYAWEEEQQKLKQIVVQ